MARLEVGVESLSAASGRARLELATSAGETRVGRLPAGGSKSLQLEAPARLPERFGAAATGVLVLRTTEGEPWDAARWSAPLGLEAAVVLASASAAPPELGGLLLEALATDWETRAAEAERGDELPARLQAFAAAREALTGEERRRLDEVVTGPLLERIDRSEAPRRLRRDARSALDG